VLDLAGSLLHCGPIAFTSYRPKFHEEHQPSFSFTLSFHAIHHVFTPILTTTHTMFSSNASLTCQLVSYLPKKLRSFSNSLDLLSRGPSSCSSSQRLLLLGYGESYFASDEVKGRGDPLRIQHVQSKPNKLCLGAFEGLDDANNSCYN